MRNKRQYLSIILSVIISVLLVTGAVWAATTIGTNISTDGPLTVNGAILGGYSGNTIASGVTGSAILSGGQASSINSIESGNSRSVIVGGEGNTISTPSSFGADSFIGAGYGNTIDTSTHFGAVIVGGQSNKIEGDGQESFIGGGYTNTINPSAQGRHVIVGGSLNATEGGGYATIVGGQQNEAGHYAFVGGGSQNVATNTHSMIVGGSYNKAIGHHSFASGYYARAIHDGAFVWTDYSGRGSTLFKSELVNEFALRAGGGFRLVADGSNDLFKVFDNTDEVFTILDGGNVGIGTTSPDHLLHVSGGALCVDDANGICGSQTLGTGDAYIAGNVTVNGIATTTDYIYLPTVHFQQGVATSANPNVGECFMPANQLKCYDGTAWQYAW
jgi:hypothetical protein